MRMFRVMTAVGFLLFGSACSDDSSADDPISEPDITREVEEVPEE